ncbi:MAG: DUF1573 domain-containing protein [Flavobacteriales bacterium]|nr:DUF1573 domain-containing protein [Flavobacteriales bacterium]
MRCYILLTLGCLTIVSCGDSDGGRISTDMIHMPATASMIEATAQSVPQILFTASSIDLGTLVEGQSATAIYEFSNTGEAPLVIADVSTSCGCTAARDWPRHPIHSGKKGRIEVTFDSRLRPGLNEKSIFVVSNANPSTTELTLKSLVIGPQSSPIELESIQNTDSNP